MRDEYKVPGIGSGQWFQLRAARALRTFAVLLLVTGGAQAAPPSTALISSDGNHAVWPKDDGSGFWLSAHSNPTADWASPKEISIRGLAANAVFSPDGKRIAFENPRGGYSTQAPNPWGPTRSYTWGYIAVYDLLDGRISYVNPSFAKDSNPHWLDDHTIAYTRRFEGLPDAEMSSPVGALSANAAPAPASANRKFLETLLGAPLLYQPTRSGDAQSIAFAAREGGTRSVYFARLHGPAKALVRYPDDDGQQLWQIAVSRDGQWVAYVHGGDPNAKDEIPNPGSVPQPPQQQVWLVNTADGVTKGAAAAQFVAAGAEPQFSPDGRSLLWLSVRGIAMAALPADRSGTLGAVNFVLPGPAESLRFSPDGKRIAYERSLQIEVYDFASKTTWGVAKPSEAVDSDPSWSADGRRIAFRRSFGHHPFQTGAKEAFVDKQPWAIWVADPSAHEAHQVWRAAAGMGSAYYRLDQDSTDAGSVEDQLLWSNDGQIAFAWEHDGWRHLYAVSADGGAAHLLTPGDGEVESATVSLDHTQLIYATNIGDLERRHLAKVSFAGGAPVQLTSGTSSQWSATATDSGSLAYIEAGWEKPATVIWQDSTHHLTDVGPSAAQAFPAAKLVQPRAVSFHGTDGGTAYGQLFVPAKPNGCGVVFVHGGIKRQMLLGFHYLDAYANLYELNQYFASRGCSVLSVEYRSSVMRGYAYRNAAGWGVAGASEYLDVLGGANYLKSRTDLRIKNIGIYGLSWGGYLTAQALSRNSDVFKVGFDMAGVHSFPDDGYQYSPMAFAAQWRSPIYLAAGDDDRNVDFNQTIELIQALHTNPQKVEIVEKVIPNETHPLSLTFEHMTDLYWEGSEFMLKHLIM